MTFSATFAGYKKDERELSLDIDRELQARQDLIAGFWDNLVLDTPDPVINTMFAFAKIRGAESIYDTKGGLMHGPGGESYYAAMWANDQAEYINPFFPYLGYEALMSGQEPVIVAMRRWSLMVLPVMLCPKEIRQKPKSCGH